jgi:hypothetical protein
MSMGSIARLFIGVLLLVVVMVALIVYIDQERSRLNAEQASLSAESYEVGIDYSGFITGRYIDVGQTVNEGDILFHIQSNMLLERLQDESVQASQLSYVLNDNNEVVIAASKGGIVSRVDYAEGSFVPANSELASITASTDNVSVSATFRLSRRDFSRLQAAETIDVVLLDGRSVSGNIITISVVEQDELVVAVVNSELVNIDNMPFIADGGTPVEASITLHQQTLYQRLRTNAETLVDRVRQ